MPFVFQGKGSFLMKFDLLLKFIDLFIYFKSAVWAIIKALLPAKAVELVKFVDKKTIKDYINDDQLFVHMGGTVSLF